MNPSYLHLLLLGPPEVRLGDRALRFPTRKTLALLVYLALESGAHQREHLVNLFYPESSAERSHANLRNTLGRLQSVLRPADGQAHTPFLFITHDTMALNLEAGIELDLQTIEDAYTLARADRSSRMPPEGSSSVPLLQAAAACQRGDFLAGFSLGDAPDFDDWVDIQREVWRRRLSLILDRLSEFQFASGEFASATETAARWIRLDVWNEVAYRLKMRAHFAAGERGQALETYDACRSVLKAELCVEPDMDTQALAELIRSQHPRPRPASRSDTPVAFLEALFAGRTREQQVLVECYQGAVAGQPQLLVLRGEIGIGKTRLVTEFLTWATVQGAEILHGDAFESSRYMPFHPLREALRLWIERKDIPQDWVKEAWFVPLCRLLPELRLRFSDPSLALDDDFPLQTEGSQAQLFEPFVRLTMALAKQAPLVLFVDDLQWADSATLDLLQYAIRRWKKNAVLSDNAALPGKGSMEANAARIWLLVSLRSEALHPLAQPHLAGGPPGLIEWLAQIEREIPLRYLELETLSEQETIQMMQSILLPPAVDFAQWVFDETNGQPFYLMETLKDLLERRVLLPIRQAAGKWAFTVDAEHDLGKAARVPSTVRAVIRSRLNRISPNAFSLLTAGAVLEHRITFERLCAISNLSEDLGLVALDELVSSRLLLEGAQSQVASAYTFVNYMIRDVVYTEAGDARRRLFHRRALDTLTAANDSAAVLAHHALAAGLPDAAFRHCLAAGQEALHLSITGEAIVHFEQARRLVQEVSLSKPPSESEWHDLCLQLGHAYQLAGQPEKALSIYEELERPGMMP
jgi:DNA-binding SARP family transcriptional activator